MSGPPTAERRPTGAASADWLTTKSKPTVPQPRGQWRFSLLDESPIGELGTQVRWLQVVPDCPGQHLERLRSARVRSRCREHDCALCYLRFGGGFCESCELAVIAVAEREAPPADPFCPWHGGRITGATRSKTCSSCTVAWSRAKRAGWKRPTGHEGVDCLSCWVCGLCKGTGRVCRQCRTCDEHTPDLNDPTTPTSDCVRTVWSRARRRDIPFHDPDLFDPARQRWRR